MLVRRWIILTLTVVLVVGSLAASTAYALHIRSERYRQYVMKGVSRFLGLPTEIGGVIPLSSRSRGFESVRIWLPAHQVQIFDAQRAVWHNARTPQERNRLDLFDSWLLLGDDQFSREDYEIMLRHSLGLDLKSLDLANIRFENSDILWRQEDFELRVQRTSGDVAFDPDGRGRASLAAYVLNGETVDEPIHVAATFTPGAGLVFHHIALDVPRIPLGALALEKLLATKITGGWFAGTLSFRQVGNEPEFSLRGRLADARLAELTTRVIGGPFTGSANVILTEATFTRDAMQSLAFSGDLEDLRLNEFAPLLNQRELDGSLDLHVHQLDFHGGKLAHLSAAADASDLSMAALTQLLGKGVITGTLEVKVNSLLVVDDTIQWADVDLHVTPPQGESGTIDRDIIRAAADKALGIDLGRIGSLLPEKVEYLQLGAKLLIDHDQLRVQGSHGRDNQTILTVRVLGQEIGIIKQPKKVFPVSELLAALRARAAQHDPQELLEWWKRKQERDAGPP
jgi:hypothetical protein